MILFSVFFTQTYWYNKARVLEVLVKKWQGYDPDSAQMVMLEDMANLCPFEGGKAVSEAQGLLSYYWDEQYDMNYASCQNVNPRLKTPRNGSDNISVYPNPGTGVFHISVPEEFYYSTLTINSFDGLEQKHINTSNNKVLTIDLGDLSAGVYFYTFENKNKLQKSGKIILIR